MTSPGDSQMTDPVHTTVYYNSACPVCDAGIRTQKDRMQGCSVEWVDVHRNPSAITGLGASLEEVRERLHVKDSAGRIQVGAPALAELWSQTPGQRAWARAARLPLLGAAARLSYNVFARLLYRWNRMRGRW
jgi:predicted DCC family thiol-disulfide oxidoreductase YuxK